MWVWNNFLQSNGWSEECSSECSSSSDSKREGGGEGREAPHSMKKQNGCVNWCSIIHTTSLLGDAHQPSLHFEFERTASAAAACACLVLDILHPIIAAGADV